ncbi:M20/M25/M40 family metallo-hydrolase [Streptomyces sp. TLI_171]|uniref:M20/M25/M40 family metallo-hydrolase n=1 Tax=Streptomyces sp. TLI_171 TaxID=1938859 RepID=UPI000C4EDA29|nr:M20/M25/M40 family metallo-hydrolase [Streptomyces sp. TLI_171]RKE23585.1 glutamate carboxypeptidase [Streptomyces sp. TLI_171]
MSAPAEQASRPAAAALAAAADTALPRYLDDLAELVAIDSGSYNAHGVNQVADWLEQRLLAIGFTVERVAPEQVGGRRFGDVLVARLAGSVPIEDGGARILLVGHMDTVFEDGTAAGRPFRTATGRAHGPGVSDDKGGLLAGVTAAELLVGHGRTAFAELIVLATPDEEIGSPASRPVTERTAQGAHYALGLECARENGDLVIERKGVADLLVTVTGRAAHAGIEPERGANAALAAAHLVVALQALNGRWPGVTLNVGVVRAGTRTNIVCPEAELQVEVRAGTTAALAAAIEEIRAVAGRTVVEGTVARVDQVDLCPPMEHTPAAAALLAAARRTGTDLGLQIAGASTGGVGDANLTSGLGIPTLDGLGPIGGADHTPEEWLDTASAPARIALLAALIERLGRR